MSYRERITIEPGKRGGKPCIRGLRITVYDILEYLAGGMTEQQILTDFPDLEVEDIRACLAFAADRERKLVSVPPAWSYSLTKICHPASLVFSNRFSLNRNMFVMSVCQLRMMTWFGIMPVLGISSSCQKIRIFISEVLWEVHHLRWFGFAVVIVTLRKLRNFFGAIKRILKSSKRIPKQHF